MGEAEIVYEILDKIRMPTGKETAYFPKWKGSPIEGRNDRYGKGFVATLDKWQSVFLGQMISEKVGERYAELPFQTSYDLVHNDRSFKKMMADYKIINREVIRRNGDVISVPIVSEVDGELRLNDGCRSVKANIDAESVIKTLASAKLFKQLNHNVCDWGIIYENDGISSVKSGNRFGCFAVGASWPSSGPDRGVVAFVKTGKAVEKPKVRKIAESEYQQFLKDPPKSLDFRKAALDECGD
ncbi:MAG: hypothetical protein V1887_02135 [Candidatus Aenigmatarchaeota archaeon]